MKFYYNKIIYMGITLGKAEKKQQTHKFTYQHMVKPILDKPFANDYRLLDLIGKGSYAEVFRGQSIKTKNVRAVKRIDRRKHAKIQPLLLNQFDILKELDHPNILKVYQIYGDGNYYYIVTELCNGKELFDILKIRKSFSEEQACAIFYQLASAVSHMHDKSVMHRDLKPENMMYNPENQMLKIIDFGSAVIFEGQENTQRRRVGTSYYIAPEVLERNYNNKCDVWSAGVVLFVLLAGQPPFKGKEDQQILAKVKEGKYSFKHENWEKVSVEAKMLITDMLKMNPKQRPSMRQVMEHEWIRKNLKKDRLDIKSQQSMARMLTNMKTFKDIKSKSIQEGVLVFMVNFIKNPNDEAELIKCFKDLDLNGDGLLSKEELSIGLAKYLKMSEKEAEVIAEGIFKKVDTNASGFIDYSEFLVSASNIQMTVTEQNLDIAFDFMDSDNNGYLSTAQMRERLGDNIPQETYVQLMKEFKLNKQKQISKKDFIAMMRKLISHH